MAIVDANYKFIYLDIGVNGRISDGGVFDACSFSKELSSNLNARHIPNDEKLPNSDITCPYVLVADEAFPLTNHIMKPYPMRSLTKERQIFNYRLSRARRIVENAFGILSSRFQVMRSPIRLHPDKVDKIILTTCLLHNFLRKDRSIIQHDITYPTIDLHNLEINKSANSSTLISRNIRDQFCKYVNNEGAVRWQNEM